MTTHSMEEAEALCNRIGIMAHGQLQCIGSAPHLKKKFGKGYTLTVNVLKVSPDETDGVELVVSPSVVSSLSLSQGVQMTQDTPTSHSDHNHSGPQSTAIIAPSLDNIERRLEAFVCGPLSAGQGRLLSSINRTKKYLIPKGAGVHISQIFKEMELNKKDLYIREWGLSMSTLEDVFITAVRNRAEVDEEEEEGTSEGESKRIY
jgi:ATP-binding cassette, subfamily A (ABC1), member 3